MADSILRLKVETSEYDSKLKNAAAGLQHMAKAAHDMGASLVNLEKEEVAFIRELGSMNTSARTASGAARELENAYKGLAATYNSLSEEEKKDEGGKALAASLAELKARTLDAKKNIDDATRSLKDNEQGGSMASRALDVLKNKFTINIDALKLFNAGLSVAQSALGVAKDAFFQTESNIDEWGRTVKGAQGAYDIFLQTLNNGNWSNFLQNLGTAVRGARDLYDVLDRLGSIKANNQAAIAIVQQQIAHLRLLKQQGQNVDAQLKNATQRLAILQGQSVNAGKKAGSETIYQTVRNGVNSISGGDKVSDATVRAAIGGILTKGQAEFDKYANNVKVLRQKGMVNVTRSDMDGNRWTEQVFNIDRLTKEQQRQYKLSKAITDRETEIQKGISLYAQAVQESTAAAREEFKGNRYALQGSTKGGSGKGGKTTKPEVEKDEFKEIAEGLIPEAQQKVKDIQDQLSHSWDEGEIAKLNQDLKTANEELQRLQNLGKVMEKTAPDLTTMGGLAQYISEHKKIQDSAALGGVAYEASSNQLMGASALQALTTAGLKGGIDASQIADTVAPLREALSNGIVDKEHIMELITDVVAAMNEQLDEKPLKMKIQVDNSGIVSASEKMTSEVEKQKEAWKKTGTVMGLVGQAFNAIEDPAAKVMGTVAQAIASVALAYADAMVKDQSTKPNLFAFIAAAAAATIGMVSTIATIHSATGYAQGGIVEGNSYSGDNIMANGGTIGLDAGELVLNRAQQGVLADSLERGSEGRATGGGSPYVTGETIYLGLSNYLRSHGYGEIVTSRR